MSSLSATQSDGYYIPPAYHESGAYKKQSINQFQNSKGHNQYLQRSVVRFELPYDGFCTGCDGHVGKGTRFNAHRAEAGAYFTSKIYEFTMKCRLCAQSTFVIKTNPQGRCFDYVSGIKKKVEEFDTVEAGTAGVIDTDLGNGIVASSSLAATDADLKDAAQHDDPLSKLESSAMGERKVMTERDQMEALLKLQTSTMMNDADSNAALRSKFRVSRKPKKRRLANAASSGLGYGIEVDEKSNVEEREKARLAFGSKAVLDQRARKREKDSFLKVRSGSIFSGCNSGVKNKKSMHGGSQGAPVKSKKAKSTANIGECRKPDITLKKAKKVSISSSLGKSQTATMTTPKSDDPLPGNESTETVNEENAPAKETAAAVSSLSALADYGSDSDASD